jgi:hypothetical protein
LPLRPDVGCVVVQDVEDEMRLVLVGADDAFSEWTQVIPNARLCKALLDRITDRAYIIETGADSFRFRRTVEKGRTKITS